MIVDVHAHYTQAPAQLDAWRARQLYTQNKPAKAKLAISDEMIVASLAGNLREMQQRGITRMMFSPRASGMGHEFGGELVSRYWTETNNDLIARACKLLPDHFTPVMQLPQTPGLSPKNCLEEIDRCVTELGFVACNVNPDVSAGGLPFTPSLGDEWWYPLWEKLVQLDIPGMIHPSSTINPGLHLNGSHYLNWDTAAVVELCYSRVFEDFPALKLIIPHGGGAIPFQFNRQRGLHVLQGRKPFEEAIRPLYFDLAVYDADSMAMILQKIGADRLLYASEMFGTAQAIDPLTGRAFDDTVPMVRAIPGITQEQQDLIFFGNAQRLYSRARW